MNNRKNVLVIDSNEKEAKGVIDAISNTTKQDWEIIVRKNNDRTSRLANIFRYIKYFTISFELFLNRNNYYIIITWQQFYGLFLAMYCRIFQVNKKFKLVIMQIIYKEKQGFFHKIYYDLYRYAIQSPYIDAFVCGTKVECQNYSRLFNIPKDKFHLIQWGLKDYTSDYTSDYEFICNDDKYVFSAGRSNRDWDFILRTIGGKKYNAIVIGAPLDHYNKYSNIKFLKNVSNDVYFSTLAHAFCVFISLKEDNVSAGQITLIEALEFGKPIIVTNSKGLSADYIINGENGIIVEKDESAVVSALELLYSNDDYYSYISANARKTYLDYFSDYRMGNDIGNLLCDL